ncbi:MAG: hypothetical protein V2A67_09680 [Bacteroidota bacterium]
MKTNEIKILLQKFFDGMTTPEEEMILEEFFLSGQAHPGLETEERMFREILNIRNKEIPVPEDLEFLVLNRLAPLQNQPERSRKRIIYYMMSAAAIIVLLISSVIFLNRQDQSMTISDPKLAYSESREALEMVSSMLNRGTAGLSTLNKLNTAVKPLQNLSSIDKAANELSILSKFGDALESAQKFANDK